MYNLFFTLFLGFILGVKHAFDADHLVAISTLVSHHKNPLKAAFVGTFWGIGHTVSLFVVGMIVILLKISIPEKVGLGFEILVGVMLVYLGIRTLIKKEEVHTHEHTHDGLAHEHLHIDTDHQHRHSHLRKHGRSLIIGMIHGLAGSGALTILVLTTITSAVQGIIYILIFGVGSIIGMSIMSMVFGLPFIFTNKKFPYIEVYLKYGIGILSIIFGFSMIYELGRELLRLW